MERRIPLPDRFDIARVCKGPGRGHREYELLLNGVKQQREAHTQTQQRQTSAEGRNVGRICAVFSRSEVNAVGKVDDKGRSQRRPLSDMNGWDQAQQ